MTSHVTNAAYKQSDGMYMNPSETNNTVYTWSDNVNMLNNGYGLLMFPMVLHVHGICKSTQRK